MRKLATAAAVVLLAALSQVTAAQAPGPTEQKTCVTLGGSVKTGRDRETAQPSVVCGPIAQSHNCVIAEDTVKTGREREATQQRVVCGPVSTSGSSATPPTSRGRTRD